MKVNNITRLMVACLWCCSMLFAANPTKEKPIEFFHSAWIINLSARFRPQFQLSR